MGSTIAVLLIALALLALVPTRRLHHAGWRPGALATYWIALTLLGLLVAEFRGPARYLLPVYLIAYGAPFVTGRAGIDRLLGRGGARGGGPKVTVSRPIRRVGSSDEPGDPPGDRENG